MVLNLWGRTLTKKRKVLLRLSSCNESRKFGTQDEGNSMAPTSLVYQNLKKKIYPEVWDAIVLSILKAMREPVTWVKQYSSHTFFIV